MANIDAQILAKGSVAVPLDYEVKPGVQLLLKMVQATFTDNSAAGAWLPCVTLISDSGDVLGRAVDKGVIVAAGSDAEVTWFPGVRASGSGVAALRAQHFDTDPGFTVPKFTSSTLGWPNPATISNPSIFSQSSGANNLDTVHLLAPGAYLATLDTTWDVGVNFVHWGVITGTGSLDGVGLDADSVASTYLSPDGFSPLTTRNVRVGWSDGSDSLTGRVFNGDAGTNRHVVTAQLVVVYLGASPPFTF